MEAKLGNINDRDSREMICKMISLTARQKERHLKTKDTMVKASTEMADWENI
jgi:hypothetical protein